MEVGVSRAAAYLGLSERRVRKMVSDQIIPARREGGRWLIEEAALNRVAPISRPMSPRIAWSMIEMLEGHDPAKLRSDERKRLRSKIDELRPDARSLASLRSWWARRAARSGYAAAGHDILDLAKDPRIFSSGFSDARSGMSSAHELEAYVHPDDLKGLVADFLLVDRGPVNVWLHISDHRVPRPVPLALVIADLADAQQPREAAVAQSLMAEMLS